MILTTRLASFFGIVTLGGSVIGQEPAPKEAAAARAAFQALPLSGEIVGERWTMNQFNALLSKENLIHMVRQRDLVKRWRLKSDNEAAEKLKGMVWAQVEGESDVIVVETRNVKGPEGAEMANGLVEAWAERRIEAQKAAVTREIDQLRQEADTMAQRVEAARLEMLALSKKRGGIGEAESKAAEIKKVQEVLVAEQSRLLSLKVLRKALENMDPDTRLRALLRATPDHPSLAPAFRRLMDARGGAQAGKQKPDPTAVKTALDQLQEELEMSLKDQDSQMAISEATCAGLGDWLAASREELLQARAANSELEDAAHNARRLQEEFDQIRREITRRKLALVVVQEPFRWLEKAVPPGN